MVSSITHTLSTHRFNKTLDTSMYTMVDRIFNKPVIWRRSVLDHDSCPLLDIKLTFNVGLMVK